MFFNPDRILSQVLLQTHKYNHYISYGNLFCHDALEISSASPDAICFIDGSCIALEPGFWFGAVSAVAGHITDKAKGQAQKKLSDWFG